MDENFGGVQIKHAVGDEMIFKKGEMLSFNNKSGFFENNAYTRPCITFLEILRTYMRGHEFTPKTTNDEWKVDYAVSSK